MIFKSKCPHCGSKFKTAESRVGKKGRCPKCKKTFLVELPSESHPNLSKETESSTYRLAPHSSRSSHSPEFHPNLSRDTENSRDTGNSKVAQHKSGPGSFALFLGLFMWFSYVMAYGLKEGLIDWVIQQFVLLSIAAGLLTSLEKTPVINILYRDINKLMKVYEENPDQLNIFHRMIPFYNLWLYIKDFKLMAPILLIGMPFEIALEAITRFVIPIPAWGLAAKMSFVATIGMELLLTLLVGPYLVLAALCVRSIRNSD